MSNYACFILNGMIGILRVILLVEMCIMLLYVELLVIGLILSQFSIHTDEDTSIFLAFISVFYSFKCL